MDDQLVQSFNRQTKLPIEIIYIILKYLHQPQHPKLLADISHFFKTMSIITNNYYKKWIVVRESMKGKDINWLENDVMRYANQYAPTCLGIQPKFKEIISRFCTVKKASHYNFQKYLDSNKISPKITMNILWGLFTIEERDEFIKTSG
jgi:hypothetical protein